MVAPRPVAVLAGILSVVVSLALVSTGACATRRGEDSCREKEKEADKVGELKKAIAEDPGNMEKRIELGELYMQIGGRRCGPPGELYGEALEEARKAVELSPDDAGANLLLGWCLLKFQDKSKDAIEPLKKVLKQEPDNAEAHYLLGKAFMESGDPDGAIEHLEKVEELSSGDIYNVRGRFRSELRRSLEMSELQKQCESGAAAWRDYSKLAQYYNRSGCLEEAKKVLLQAASHADLRAYAYQELGYILRSQSKYEEALKAYRKALASVSKNEAGKRPEKREEEEAILHLAMGDVYATLGKPKKALSAYDKADELRGHTRRDVSRKRGEIYTLLGEPGKAAPEYEKGGAAIKSARAYRDSKGYDKALEVLWRKIAEESEKPEARSERGREAVDRSGNPVEGLRYKVDPELYKELGDTYRAMGQNGKAVMAYWEALRLDPSSAAASQAIEELSSVGAPSRP